MGTTGDGLVPHRPQQIIVVLKNGLYFKTRRLVQLYVFLMTAMSAYEIAR
jgi:hypothetical protein